MSRRSLLVLSSIAVLLLHHYADGRSVSGGPSQPSVSFHISVNGQLVTQNGMLHRFTVNDLTQLTTLLAPGDPTRLSIERLIASVNPSDQGVVLEADNIVFENENDAKYVAFMDPFVGMDVTYRNPSPQSQRFTVSTFMPLAPYSEQRPLVPVLK